MANKLPVEISNIVFSETTLWLLENRPPEEIRPKLDIYWRIDGQSVYIYEIRPDWIKPKIIRHSDFAKATYIKSKEIWKIFWMRADLNWHSYKPQPIVKLYIEFLEEVSIDPYGCFKG